MLRGTPVAYGVARIWRARSAWPLLLALAALVILHPAVVDAAQLDLSWTDMSAGQAAFSIERKTGTTGSYAEIARQAAGSAFYTDGTVAAGTTYCYRVRAFDGAGVSDYSNEACGAASGGLDVAVVTTGTASGTVSSSPVGIVCGTDCSESYPGGTVVTLTATPAAGASFAGWSGGGCTGTDPCVLAGNGSVVVTSTFAAIATASVTYTVTVTKKGSGTVTSSPGGISCGSTCSAAYAKGTMVTLTAVPGRGSQFTGWSGGGCSGTGPCTVTVDADVSVAASFSKIRKR